MYSPRLSIFSSFANDKLNSENCVKSRPNGIACLRKGKLRQLVTVTVNAFKQKV